MQLLLISEDKSIQVPLAKLYPDYPVLDSLCNSEPVKNPHSLKNDDCG